MMAVPRIAVGTIQPAADPTPVAWALVGYLQKAGQQVQIFHDQARLPDGGQELVCGQAARYLDSWLMSPNLCRQSFLHGSSGSDLSLVVGRFTSARVTCEQAITMPSGGTLEDLCNWLELPQIAIVDVAQLAPCQLPPCPAGVSGLLLDRVPDDQTHYWQTVLEALWGVPVLGALPELPTLRKQIRSDTALSSCVVCRDLAAQLARHLQFPKLMKIADRQAFPLTDPQIFSAGNQLAGVTVAMAYDEAFNGYFPDVLDLLELHGATVTDFSPLRDGALPTGTDVVYIGCGHPQRYAAQLASNHCMTFALRDHVRQGRRIYGEGGGMAYLCQTLCVPSGQCLPMVGVLPAVASYVPADVPAQASEVTLARDLWLGPAGFKLSGYLDPCWHLEPAGPLESCVSQREARWDITSRGQAVGSRLQLNFAAQPDFLRQFSPPGNQSLNISPAH